MWIDLCRAKELKPLSSLSDVVLSHVVEAACSAVETYLGYSPELTEYDELYQGTNTRSLFLRNYPVTEVKSVRYGRQVAVTVVNNTQNTQAAQVKITDTGLTCSLSNNGTTTDTALTYSSFPTLGEMAGAINALGNGWVATLSPRFDSWSSEDLAIFAPAAMSARTVTALLSPHFFYMSDYQIRPNTGELLHGMGWWGGYGAYRVTYTAGYDVIPEDLVQATCELASATYLAAQTNPAYQAESLGNYSYTRATTQGMKSLSTTTYQTLKFYRRPNVAYFRS